MIAILEMGAASIVINNESQMDEIIRQINSGRMPYKTILVDMGMLNCYPSHIALIVQHTRKMNVNLWIITPAGEQLDKRLIYQSERIVSQEALMRFGVKNVPSYLANKARMNGGRQ